MLAETKSADFVITRLFDAPPTGGADGMVPVVLPTNGVGMVPKARDDMVVVDAGIVGAPPITDGETALVEIKLIGIVRGQYWRQDGDHHLGHHDQPAHEERAVGHLTMG